MKKLKNIFNNLVKSIKSIFNKNKKNKLNKKIIIIAGSVVLLVIVAVVLILIFSKDNKNELNEKLENMGTSFYEEFYYKQVGSSDEERSAFLKKFESIGIKVNLDNLSRYNGQDSEAILKEFANEKNGELCDKYNTQVIIYPQEPYKQTSYKIEVELDCGFEE